MTAQTAEVRTRSPETLAQFLKLLLKGMIKRLPLKLLLAGGIALLAWIIHTYLLVVSNEGFNAGGSYWLDRILALQGRSITGSLVWTLGAGIVTSTIARIWAYGFSKTIQGVIDTPKHVWQWANELGVVAIPFLVVGYISTIFVGFFVNNSLLILQFFLVVLGIVIARYTSVLLTILRLGWGDAQRAAKRERTIPFNIAWPGMYFVGVLVGLLAILPNSGILPYVCGCLGFLSIILASVGLFVRSQGGTERLIGKKVLVWILVPALLSLFMAATSVAFADDGGWAESGGTFSGWVQSPGAVRAVLMGFLPAAGAGLGVLFGTALGGMVSIIGATGIPADPFSVQATGQPASPVSSSPPDVGRTADHRTADHQVEAFEYEQTKAEPPGESPGQMESRTADQQVERFEQQSKAEADPSTMSERHQAEGMAETDDVAGSGSGMKSERASVDEGDVGSGMRNDRAREDFQADQSRTGEAADELGTEQRDLRGVEQQGSAGSASDMGAAESAERVADLGEDRPSGQLSDRHRPDSSDVDNDGPLAERNRPGGLSERSGDESQLASQQQPDSLDTADGPLAERHQAGGMDEGAEAKPAGFEQSELGSERHSPTDTADGPLATRHDLESSDSEAGGMRARRFTEEETGPTAERFTGEARPESADLAQRHQPLEVEPETPLPPVPIPPITMAWDLVVVRTPAGSGLAVQQRLALGRETRIGRHGAIDIKILDPKVSRQHADIVVEADMCTITDLNSSNGTFINGQRMTVPQVLRPGDAIKVGDTYFVVEQRAE